MNLIRRIHDHGPAHTHDGHAASSHGAPFWVRHYDLIVNLISLGRSRAIHKETIGLADLRSGDMVLDIGCGTGMLALEAEKIAGPHGLVVGLDSEPAMIEQARDRAARAQSQVSFEIASIDNIPYADDTFDVAFSTLMVHHLTEAQKQAGFQELKRVLKPQGRLVVVDINPARRGIITSLPGHNQLKREDTVRHEVTAHLRAAGLTVVEDGAHPTRQFSYAIGRKN